ncbi:hypothetical protein [Sporocytophaga sp.]|uniref:hypothetical protein n=1 Tax=Sporocytophaga sp. TaxID=2231183 RepID=UPI0025F50259|nr:hypothetical protein [Sporocytophaga sp.]
MFKLFGDHQVAKFYNKVTLRTEQEAQRFLDLYRDRFNNKVRNRWGVALKAQKSIVGTIDLIILPSDIEQTLDMNCALNFGIKVI